jgi:hypothetical protein
LPETACNEYVTSMLTPSQLVLAQADAIARLARLRAYASTDLTDSGQLVLQLTAEPNQARTWIRDTLGNVARNIALVMIWEKRSGASV